MKGVANLYPIKSLINDEQFYHDFQPIIDIQNGRMIGYEVLFRSKATQNPLKTFEAARKENLLFELDSRSIKKAISSYQNAGYSKKEGYIFVNIFPSTILNPAFPSFVENILLKFSSTQHIVFEISESEIIYDYKIFQHIIFQLKGLGCLIAIDDVGAGNSSMKSIIELEPDYIKLDMYFSEDLNKNIKKQRAVYTYLNYCNETNTKLILEGIEVESDLLTSKKLGVHFAQGYLLGKPKQIENVESYLSRCNRP